MLSYINVNLYIKNSFSFFQFKKEVKKKKNNININR